VIRINRLPVGTGGVRNLAAPVISRERVPMMSLFRRSALLACVLAAFGFGARAELASFAKSPLVIDTSAGPQHFTVDLALSPEQQQQGLMFRQSLAADAGMLFDFGATRPATFWMKNTLIPLDMLFIAADGHIADFHERAVPLSEAVIESKVPVRAVLELNGGSVARLGIHRGDLVHHAIFGTAGG
jgi:uncharacterized membrane protein (UPF0127 family)